MRSWELFVKAGMERTSEVQTVEAEVTTTVSVTDALSGTDLRQAPGNGAVAIFLASTVADSLATVNIGAKALKSNTLVSKVATNAQIDINADAPIMTTVRKGDQIRVSVTVVSAATIRVKAIWQGVIQ